MRLVDLVFPVYLITELPGDQSRLVFSFSASHMMALPLDSRKLLNGMMDEFYPYIT
jgi:hypothetical protein